MSDYTYLPTLWLDEIIEIDDQGRVIYETDEQGNILYMTDDYGNIILHPITNNPIPKPKLLQIGTRHSASRENNQEDGILMAHKIIGQLINRMIRVETQLEIDGRVDPDNKGTFFDNFINAPDKLIRLLTSATLTESRSAGTTVLNVDSANGFTVGMEVTIYDGANSEDVIITSVTASTITVSPLVNSYTRGAIVTRTTADIVNGQLINGSWDTYSVSVLEVV